MSLYRWELKKILGRRAARLALALILLWTVAGTLVNVYVNNGYTISNDLPRVSGPEEIANQLAWAERWRGPLTGEKLAQAQGVIYDFYHDPANRTPDGNVDFDGWVQTIRPMGGMGYTLSDIAAAVYDYPYAEATELEPHRLLTYYDDRAAAVTRWLDSQFDDPADRAVFEAQEAGVQTPFHFDWYGGQFTVLETFRDILIGVCLLLGIALAPVFSDEVQSGVLAVSHCTRRGRRRLALAKLAAALTVAALVWCVVAALLVAGQLFFFGTRGLDCPIQLFKPLATAPLTFGDCERFALVLGLACCLGTAGITAGVSGLLGSNFAAMAVVFGLLVLQPMFAGMLPDFWRQLVGLMPTAVDFYDLFCQNLYHFGPLRLWSPLAQLAAQPLWVAVMMPVAGVFYVRRQVR